MRDLDAVDAIAHNKALPGEQQTLLRHAVRYPTSTWDDVEYFREWIRRLILEQAITNLGLPAALTGTGVLCSTVAGVWALYL
ncbi:hypothetical protein ABZ832_09275 [Streptantibioticus parmotrematis]|uniref:hypothetical protein n=1 Tax=Streptantibioticus parmotrematis TaxID=2873249 RepID=UPI0033E592CE